MVVAWEVLVLAAVEVAQPSVGVVLAVEVAQPSAGVEAIQVHLQVVVLVLRFPRQEVLAAEVRAVVEWAVEVEQMDNPE